MIAATVLIIAGAAGAGALKAVPAVLNPASVAGEKTSPAVSDAEQAMDSFELLGAPAFPEISKKAEPAPSPAPAQAAAPARSIKNSILNGFSKLEDSFRKEHARELMGKYYDHSVVRAGEKADEIDSFGVETVRRKLSKKWKPASEQIYFAIKTEARRFGFDPLFLIAVIDGESSFKPEIRGPVGEIGMMQLRAETAEWVAGKYHMAFQGEKSLEDPITNIQLGAAYLAYLRDQHDSHSRLYLSAYNMGSRNVKKALDKSIWPKDYAQHVMKRYVKLYTRLKQSILDRSSASSELPKAEVKAALEARPAIKAEADLKPESAGESVKPQSRRPTPGTSARKPAKATETKAASAKKRVPSPARTAKRVEALPNS